MNITIHALNNNDILTISYVAHPWVKDKSAVFTFINTILLLIWTSAM